MVQLSNQHSVIEITFALVDQSVKVNWVKLNNPAVIMWNAKEECRIDSGQQ